MGRRNKRSHRRGPGFKILEGGKVTAAATAEKPVLVVNLCRHYHGQYHIDPVVRVWPSSLLNERTVDNAPDFGLYADWSWKPWWRNEHIDWADFGLPWDLDIAHQQIVEALGRAAFGQKVEVGCLGGHGRTGTILAAMHVIASGMDPMDAIKQVRDNYCSNAIETDEQEWFVKFIAARQRREEPPPRDFVPFIYSDQWQGVKREAIKEVLSEKFKVVQPCKPEQHYEMWNRGNTHCVAVPGNCRYFDDDVLDFVSGYVPETVLIEEYEREQQQNA